jgi:hypothetical protein
MSGSVSLCDATRCQRRTGRTKIGAANETRYHRKMDDQSRNILLPRDIGLQGRMTPDRTRGMKVDGISPSFSVKSPGQRKWLAHC